VPEPTQRPAERPLSYFQRRLHCRVALSAARRLSPVRDDVPAPRGTPAESDDVIVVGCGSSSDAKRTVSKFQPKLEPGIEPPSVRVESTAQLTTVVEQPRRDVVTTHQRDGSSSRRAEPPRGVTVAPFNVDQSTAASAPQTQPQTVPEPPENNNRVVKRGRGRPRKYPPKQQITSTASTLPSNVVPTLRIPRLQISTSKVMRARLISDDKENVSPLSSAVVAAKHKANELDRNIWTSNAVRNAASTSKSILQASGVMANKVAERQRLVELPVNVVLSDDNNNFQKKPSEKMSPNFRLKDLDKDKLLSVWNALKGTLQSDDWDAINCKDQTDDAAAKCQIAEQRCVVTEVVDDKRQEQLENSTTELKKKPSDVLPTPLLEAEPPSDAVRQLAANTIHWKCPETNDVRRSDNKLPNVEFSDEHFAAELPKTPFPFVDDFDDTLPLSASLGKPLFTSTPIKQAVATSTSACAAAVPSKRARVRFRPVTQAVNDDEEDAGDRVELSKLAAQHGAMSSATQISGVRPADIVRAFRTIDNVATAAATSTLALQSHGLAPALPFAVPPSQTNVRAPIDLYQRPPVHSAMINAGQTVATEASSPVTMTTTSLSNDASPLPSEIVRGQLLHFYGAHHDGPPYNHSPSTGGFVTKAARKRPIADDLDAPNRKRFQPEVLATAAPAVSSGHVSGEVVTSASARSSAQPPRPEMSRPAAGGQCRRAAEMTSREAAVRRAPNGVPVDDLLRLQRKLSTIGDAATLRRVVQIIGETGRYCVNDVTFDFDLCNLDSTTVSRLIQCLDAAAL